MGEAAEVALRFNDHINAGDLVGLVSLMSPDHRFVDTAGTVVAGAKACAEAWRGFFAQFPGYRNIFETVSDEEGTVRIAGRSECPGHSELTGPAHWTATVMDGLVTEWRVHA